MTLRFLKIWGFQKLNASLPYSWFPRKQKFYSVLVVTWNQLKIKTAILNQNLDISKIVIYQISYAWPTERPYHQNVGLHIHKILSEWVKINYMEIKSSSSFEFICKYLKLLLQRNLSYQFFLRYCHFMDASF